MKFLTLLKKPEAYLPIAMSIGALITLLVYLVVNGPVREPDEGTAAHIWQLLMAGQIPIIVIFLVKWLRNEMRLTIYVFTFQMVAVLAALTPVYLLKF